nr:ubiquitin conjugating enzyme E2 L3 [Hymenolepis microstoma]CUU98071.1 ubiquitin conjugating enzyme E2 L3 [Hymenolepis microstoma]
MCAATKRLQKELIAVNEDDIKEFFKLDEPGDNLNCWTGLLLPDKPPFDKGAFQIQIIFEPDYPIKPPKLTFKTPIYHPNVDEKGQFCLPLIEPSKWKPATKIVEVLKELKDLIANPEIEHPLRAELAEEYARDKTTFNKKAAEYTAKYAVSR